MCGSDLVTRCLLQDLLYNQVKLPRWGYLFASDGYSTYEYT